MLPYSILFAVNVKAQERKHMRIVPYRYDDSLETKKDSVPQKDLFDEIRKLNKKKKRQALKPDSVTTNL